MAILDTARAHGRQYPLVAIQDITYAQLTTGTAVPGIKLPFGARVIGGGLVVTTVWNSAVSDVLDIGDGVDADEYTSSQIDLTALGYTALTITGYEYTTSDWVDLTWTGSGAVPTTGAATLILMYTIDGRANEVMPDSD